ncbi:hypothetical protein BJ973_006336 [Actinoplanes tereljensis]|uniref:Uncharacterized protein n=1 Tax=Paractinoplanes tereljensis TaxID=571912 RepID=A0A919NIG0_9ACTN|nr:hypothetical protein [Actinoplanes tereljensis]GIF19291.1 hypothetical protein Ate02nite_20210 [Actinoplanes tereljensis]
MAMVLSFVGLAPWGVGIEVIECETPDGVVDMYNDSMLRSATLTCDSVPTLSFQLVDDRSGRDYFLEFLAVKDLVFKQEPLTFGANRWDPQRVKTFYGVELPSTVGVTTLEIRTIVGDYNLQCDSVRFRWG